MTFIPLQRQASPTSAGNWWGQYDSLAGLPNVAGSDVQLSTELQAGDMAYVDDIGAIVWCADPTPGSAVWEVIVVLASANTLNIFVAPDAATADDNNPGTTSALPLATLDEALRRVNALGRVLSPTVVHLATPSSPYTVSVSLELGGLDAPLVFLGDGAGQAGDDGFTELLTGTVDAGATMLQVPVTGGGLVADAFMGKTLILTSGASINFRRTINGNSATTLDVSNWYHLGAPAQNDTFRIVEPSIVVEFPAFAAGAADKRPSDLFTISGAGGAQINPLRNGGLPVNSTSMVYFANLRCEPIGGGAQIYLRNSTLCLVGCEFGGGSMLIGTDDSSAVVCGLDTVSGSRILAMPADLGLAGAPADTQGWAGWSSFWDDCGSAAFAGLRGFVGFIHTNDSVRIENARWGLLGGRISSQQGDNFGLDASRTSHVVIQPSSALSPMIIENDEDDTEASAVSARQTSNILFSGSGISINKTNRGHALAAWADDNGQGALPGFLDLTSGMTITGIVDVGTPENAVRVTGGGRCNYRASPTVAGVFNGDELAVAASLTAAPAAGSSGTVAGLAADGDAYPTVASGLTGVNGFIQRH